MDWQSKDAVTFTRPLGKTELPFSYFGIPGQDQGREHWAIHVVAELQLPATADAPSLFRKAWIALRLNLPDMDARIDHATKTKSYTSLDAPALEKWADSTFHVEHGFTSSNQIAEAIRASPSPTCHILDHGKGRVSVLINCSHSLIDAFGIMHVMNRFLALAASPAPNLPTPGSETANLVLNFEQLVGDRTPNPEAIVNRVSNRLAAYFSALPFAGFQPDFATTDVMRDTRTLELVASPETTAAFVAACRAKDVSVTAAVQSALVETVYGQVPADRRERKLGLISPIDLRRRMPAMQHGDDHAVGIFMGCLHLLSSADEGFLARAKRLKGEYALANDPEYLAHEVTELSVQVASIFAAGVPPPPEPPSSPTLSSLGIVDDVIAHKHGDIEVLGVRVGSQMLTPESLWYVWTFRGRLHFSVNYNAAYLRDASMKRGLARLLELLSGELGVRMQCAAPSAESG